MFRLTIALFIAAMCRAQGTNPVAGDPQAAETGRWTFRVLCAPCHGIHADGGRGPDLTRGVYSVGELDKDLYIAIARGVPGSEMPAYGDRLDADAVWRLVSYVRSAARHDAETVHGDAAAGEQSFCGHARRGPSHPVATQGTGLAPQLPHLPPPSP